MVLLIGCKHVNKRLTSKKVTEIIFLVKAPVAQTLDSAIHRINHYSTDKY